MFALSAPDQDLPNINSQRVVTETPDNGLSEKKISAGQWNLRGQWWPLALTM